MVKQIFKNISIMIIDLQEFRHIPYNHLITILSNEYPNSNPARII